MELAVCPNCGEENPARFRLCGFCGAPLASILPAQELRKTVTIVFSDLKGSTDLGERLDPESLREVMSRYFEAMQAELRRHGGTVEKFIGDAVMAVFGLPRLHEDDALRAVRAAHGMQSALVGLNAELRTRWGVELTNRTGVNTGEVVAGDATLGQRLVTGDAVNVAARLEQAAGPNEVLIGELTWTLVRDDVDVERVEPLELKGKSERVPAYRLLAVHPSLRHRPGRFRPLLGRETELATLRAAYEEAVSARACRLVTIVGDPGVGKSRLIDEVVSRHEDDAWILRGRCLSYGDGITFWPLGEALRAAAGIRTEDGPDDARARLAALAAGVAGDAVAVVDRLSSAIGLSAAAFPVEEIFWATRKLLEALASHRPVLFVIDDVHDAEPALLRLIDHLVGSTADAPVVILCSARHELLTSREGWADGDGRTVVALGPLAAAGSDALIEELLGTIVAAPLVERIRDAAEGNPLFIEQLAQMLLDRRVVRPAELESGNGRGDLESRSSAGLETLEVPPTLQALLAARLDQLSREERAVVEPASVIGLEFEEAAVAALVPPGLRPAVPAELASLDRKQFAHPRPNLPDPTYRFHHILIRDAAYQSLLKRNRASLHEAFVTWAQALNRERDRGLEYEEINGYHLEQAYRYRRELGPLDAEGRVVGDRAAALLESAGRRAFARNDMHAAANLLGRAVDLLDPGDPGRVRLAPELAEALMEEGEFDVADDVLVDAAASPTATEDRTIGAQIRLAQIALALYAGESVTVPELDSAPVTTDSLRVAAIEDAITAFNDVQDFAALARALRLLMVVHGTAGRYVEATEAADRCVHAAVLAGDGRLAGRGAAGYATGSLHGPLPTAEAIDRCEEMLRETSDRKAEAVISGSLGVLHAMRGDIARGRELTEHARLVLRDLGRSVTAAATSIESASVELLAGDLDAAERHLREDDAALEAIGERYFRSTIVGLLGLTLLLRGDRETALEQSIMCEILADEDDVWSQTLWRTVRGRVLAMSGNPEEAVELASAGVGIADGSADLDLQGGARIDLGEALLAVGRAGEAEVTWREAIDRYERKGNLVMAARVADRLAVSAAV